MTDITPRAQRNYSWQIPKTLDLADKYHHFAIYSKLNSSSENHQGYTWCSGGADECTSGTDGRGKDDHKGDQTGAHHESGQHASSKGEAGQDEKGQDEKGQDETGQGETGPDSTVPNQTATNSGYVDTGDRDVNATGSYDNKTVEVADNKGHCKSPPFKILPSKENSAAAATWSAAVVSATYLQVAADRASAIPITATSNASSASTATFTASKATTTSRPTASSGANIASQATSVKILKSAILIGLANALFT